MARVVLKCAWKKECRDDRIFEKQGQNSGPLSTYVWTFDPATYLLLSFANTTQIVEQIKVGEVKVRLVLTIELEVV